MHSTNRLTQYLHLLIVALLLASTPAMAEEEGEGIDDSIQYVPIKPSFVTNYMSNKLRYFKADVTVKVRGTQTAEAIDRHIPYIRHNLVMLFSGQDEASLSSIEGKQKLQADALHQVVAVLDEESEPKEVEGILFTSFIVE